MIPKAVVMSDSDRLDALASLEYRALAGEDIRWDKVSECIAQAQAAADQKLIDEAYQLGMEEVAEWVKEHSHLDTVGFFYARVLSNEEWQAFCKEKGLGAI